MLKLLRLLAWGVASVAVAVALVAGAAYWLYRDAHRPGPLVAAKALVIPAHSGLAAIAGLLAQGGVIRHTLTFETLAKLSGRGRALKPGEYEFPAGTSAVAALAIIAEGRTVRHKLTIPEGLTSPEIVALVEAAPALTGDPGPPPPEGALYPDTYVYSWGDSRQALIRRMQRAMARVVGELWKERWPGLPLAKPEDAVTLASIVEKETALPAERAHVAGVYINRLRLGMPLDADPTVLFALDDDGAKKLGRPLVHADLSLASPYNTYRVRGLPPGPIDNPGRASLRAALQPEPSGDLYFVADGAGGHVFAKTLAEQTKNVAVYLKGAPVATAAVPPAADPIPQPPPPKPPVKPPVRPASAHAPPAGTRHAVLRHRRVAARRVAPGRHCRPDHDRACHPRAR
jgi:UPF0755 protein